MPGAAPRPRISARLQSWRHLKDRLATVLMEVGGVGVIVAILLIFFYLLLVVAPLFSSPAVNAQGSYATPDAAAGRTLHLAMEEQNILGVRITDQAQAVFFRVADGEVVRSVPLTTAKAPLTAFAAGELGRNEFILGYADGSVTVARAAFATRYGAEQQKIIEPAIEFPLGEKPIVIAKGKAIEHVAVRGGDDATTLLAVTHEQDLHVVKMEKETSLLAEDEGEWQAKDTVVEAVGEVFSVLINTDQRAAYVALRSGEVINIDISRSGQAQVLNRAQVVKGEEQLTAIRFLAGGISLLVGTSNGNLSQWFPVRQETGPAQLTLIRSFDAAGGAIASIVPEQRRKGFFVADDRGQVAIYHSTANRQLLREPVSGSAIGLLAASPRANRFLAQDAQGKCHLWQVENEHPEISWSVLWGKVWYESYNEPQFTWQSSSASNDFEPKFSLVPLVFGTLKASFYAMLFAIPMAIFGAIYTAYFMSPRMRGLVKPAIEIMAALPTVILGFLAGLWLAPAIERNLLGTFLFLLILPPGTLLVAFAWQLVPATLRSHFSDGWQGALLVIPLLLIAWLAFSLGIPLEHQFFDGNAPHWLAQELGWKFDQRNSLVVGIAMGVAVIPTIFSISEDAIFSVPKHLTLGSLALGATPWQTMVRVVILTASPGIFSAVMIGLGRAVGETMIVLMATGNTPVMDPSIFQGLRTLSANIAVEMPESEVGSTHYRVLFLAALVLFVLTFMFNTLAEVIRQRLRVKYSSL